MALEWPVAWIQVPLKSMEEVGKLHFLATRFIHSSAAVGKDWRESGRFRRTQAASTLRISIVIYCKPS